MKKKMPKGRAAFNQKPQLIEELTPDGRNPNTRKQVAAPFMNMKDICPKPKRHAMAIPTAPGFPFLNPRTSLRVKTRGLARRTLPLGEGITGVSKSPDKANPKVCPI
jgi:hypothetical protein